MYIIPSVIFIQNGGARNLVQLSGMRPFFILKTAILFLSFILLINLGGLMLPNLQNITNVEPTFENYSTVDNNSIIISDREKSKPSSLNVNVKGSVMYKIKIGLSSGFCSDGNVSTPTVKYEDTRRQMELNLKEMGYKIIRAQNDKVTHPALESLKDIYRILQAQLKTLRTSDGFESFRERETKELSQIFQDRIQLLQNPKNCDKANKVVCTLSIGCGFACQITHVTHCFITAYALGYTLILDSHKWKYGSWETMFLPMSESCTTVSGQEEKVLRLQNPQKPTPPYLPASIPSDIGDRLVKVHGEPYVWWVGQFKKHILRLQPNLQETLEQEKNTLKGPIVGLHVRRTDKSSEAKFHNLTEYMRFAEEWFAIKDLAQPPGTPPLPRRVFIATDDPTVIEEARKDYGSRSSRGSLLNWDIIGDTEVAKSASLKSRYSNKSANGVVRDVFLLSECDFLVCTFSSGICRLAYELLQTKHADGSWRAQSLDDIYFYTGGNGVRQIAVLPHEPTDWEEIELHVGDEIRIWGNHWDGFSEGENLRTGQEGLYPSYKAKYVVRKVDFPKKPWWPDINERS